ncbi:MAG: SRPBCC family protein [Chitinophagales bacterium]
MDTSNKTSITVEATVHASVEKVWDYWNKPEHITQWCHASDDWYAPRAENDLRTGGKFLTTMSAKDGSVSFDFDGIYTNVEQHKLIEYSITDARKVKIEFSHEGTTTKVVETFEAESIHPHEIQRSGWQAILDNFKNYVESH